jgi:hypothetical protein
VTLSAPLAAQALLAAIVARLRADPALSGPPLDARIHDAPPRDAAFPHLVVEPVTSTDASGLDAPLERHRLALRIVSRAGGRGEAARLAATAERVLAEAPPDPEGHRLIGLMRDGFESRMARDRITAEALLRFSALTEPL